MAIPSGSTTCPACKRAHLINGACPDCGDVFPDYVGVELVEMGDVGQALIVDWPPEVAVIDGIPEAQARAILKKHARSVLRLEEESLLATIEELQKPQPAGGTGNGADEANDAEEASKKMAFLQLCRYRLHEIRRALQRCQEKRWGKCERCSDWISVLRLFADPTVRHCIECARELGR